MFLTTSLLFEVLHGHSFIKIVFFFLNTKLSTSFFMSIRKFISSIMSILSTLYWFANFLFSFSIM
ncbi:MAG: hypothetical protein EBS89_09390 [Proteobacteria bacterium]|nr:hypothetical protein [Pseudomonadota bacterium]